MLQSTFCHLPRIGPRTEQLLWKQGVHTWNAFISAASVRGIHDRNKPRLDRELRLCQRALIDGNSTHFLTVPSVESWRLWDAFREEAAFIDIETNWRNDITVLGVSDGEHVWQFVRHHNLDARNVRTVLRRYKLLVTFNGASFDLPIIRNTLRDVLPRVPHLDLRHAARRAGYTGGLKAIEEQLRLTRSAEVDGLSGADALQLWTLYRNTGNTLFRDRLLEYNAMDILNLKPLADTVYAALATKTRKFF